MTCIKSAPRAALLALAPDAPYLAAGTMSGAVDMSSASANIEIFHLDLESDSPDLPLFACAPSPDRFNRLSWSRPAAVEGDSFSLGLLAGAFSNGSVAVWNPLSMNSSEGQAEDAMVARLEKHTRPVSGLEFSELTPNWLASGADEGDLFIWDLKNPSEPTVYLPLKSVGSSAQAGISCLSWNPKFQHIVASTSSNGMTVVWDLRNKKPLTSFSDSNRRQCSVLQWNPDLSTQLIVASDDDNSPSLRVWDVRRTTAPVKEFVGHSKGVIAMSWCPYDSSFLLTCSKDNRTICWDTVSGEIISELPTSANGNFDVHWYRKIPGVIAAASFDGKIRVHNLEVHVHDLVTEQSLVSPESEAAIQSGHKSSDEEREAWNFLRVMLEGQDVARTKLLAQLGVEHQAGYTWQDIDQLLQECVTMIQRKEGATLKNMAPGVKLEKEKASKIALATDYTLEEAKIVLEQARLEAQEAEEKFNCINQKYKAALRELQELKGAVRVCVRLRPLLNGEESKVLKCFDSDDSVLKLETSGKVYHFDKVFAGSSSQSQVFQEVCDLVQNSIDGKKVCIFAYGQSGSGKTHTMLGELNNANVGANAGVIPRAIELILKETEDTECIIKLSVFELYNDKVQDLVKNGSPIILTDLGMALSEVKNAMKHRATKETKLNKTSSRSHCFFIIEIHNPKEEVIGELCLVDLAGSERFDHSATKEITEEGTAIRKSLFSLKSLLIAIAKKEVITYDKLSLINKLKPYLAAGSQVSMFINVSQETDKIIESTLSLDFATNIKSIELNVLSPLSRLRRG